MLGRFLKGPRFDIRFKDRNAAGNALALALKSTYKNRPDEGRGVVVMGIPRGGVIIGGVIAGKLSSDFDIVLPVKLRDPDNPEQAIGAMMEDGTIYLDEGLIDLLQISKDHIEKEKVERLKEIMRRKALYRASNNGYDIKDKIVILVDDGIVTGSTMIAAARWLRKERPKIIVVAAPVANPQAMDLLKGEVDAVEIMITPAAFSHLGHYYKSFDEVKDEQVIEILRQFRVG
jgi:putative phosphoribosyl transferase